MRTIPLTQGKIALIDGEDFELVSQHKWLSVQSRDNLYYAYTHIRKNGKRITSRMHRMIMDAPQGTQIDHKNGNGLDNRKCNLRFATTSQNHQNSRPYKNGTSRFKGVSWVTGRKTWRSAICCPNKVIFLGFFISEIQAAYAYNKAAKKFFGEFARVNKI